MKINLDKIPPDAIFLFIEILDKMEIDIFNLPIHENMSGDEAGTILMKAFVFKIPKVREEINELVEIIIGRKPESAAELIKVVADLIGVEDIKSFFTLLG
jgi:hypothetical protein